MSDDEEVWLVVAEHPNYEVSSKGNVRRAVAGRYSHMVGKNKKLSLGSNGYLTTSLDKHWVSVHKIVCKAFVGPQPSPFHDVAHNNGVRSDNRAGNLRWATRSENNRDMDKHMTRPPKIGEQNHNSKLTAREVLEIRRRLDSGERNFRVRADYGISKSCISAIKNKRNWKHV